MVGLPCPATPPPREARHRRGLLTTTAALSDRLATGDIAVAQIVERNPLWKAASHYLRIQFESNSTHIISPAICTACPRAALAAQQPQQQGPHDGQQLASSSTAMSSSPNHVLGMDVPPLSLIAFVNRKALPDSSVEAPAWRAETFDPRYPVLSARQAKEERLHHELSLQSRSSPPRRTRSSGGSLDAVSARACKDFWSEKENVARQIGVGKIVSYHERDFVIMGELQRLREECIKKWRAEDHAAEAILDAQRTKSETCKTKTKKKKLMQKRPTKKVYTIVLPMLL